MIPGNVYSCSQNAGAVGTRVLLICNSAEKERDSPAESNTQIVILIPNDTQMISMMSDRFWAWTCLYTFGTFPKECCPTSPQWSRGGGLSTWRGCDGRGQVYMDDVRHSLRTECSRTILGRLPKLLNMNLISVLSCLSLLLAAAVAQAPKPCGECGPQEMCAVVVCFFILSVSRND